ncbi:MAG TPA: methyltransferase domain-containing protein [Solirubrobacterales bacterium]|nr:methyltransferase domain-containing protein [Solirubrobacterales bacterium]
MDTAIIYEPDRPCAACGRAELHFVRTIESRRTGSTLNLYFCAACESFAMPSSFDQGSRPEHALEFHKRILDRNLSWSKSLFERIDAAALPRDTVVEIGCGSGATLHVAEALGTRIAVGYDLNELLSEFARDRFQVEIRSGFWDRHADHPSADMLICLSVLEHLNDPDELVGEFAAYCAEHGSVLVVSVPLHDRSRHHEAFAPYGRGSAFRAGDSHVMYYSPQGFRALLQRHGARAVIQAPIRGWSVHFVAFERRVAELLRGARPQLSQASEEAGQPA